MSENKTILVTGGAGYIGGQTVLALLDAGYSVIVLDDLSTGYIADFHSATKFYEGRVQDTALLQKIFSENRVDAVMHFAASIEVDQSVIDPLGYYENNLVATNILLEASHQAGIQSFILSSTAAVYGDIESAACETMRCSPINPYGWSKLFAENLLKNTAHVSNMKYGILRYFNVAGADKNGRHGYRGQGAKHLIGRCFEALETGKPITIYGSDHLTPDGSGVRDYISVMDLAGAHVAMFEHLSNGGGSETLNLGYGMGYSVLEVIKVVESVSGKPVPVKIGGRRKGDPSSVIANVAKLEGIFAWRAQYNDLHAIVKTAYDWHRSVSTTAVS
jgi:UDP-glucose 4-epimerase